MVSNSKEVNSPTESLHVAATRFASTFISRHDCYPIQLEDGSYVTIDKSLAPDLYLSHLYGTITLGTYALDQQSNAKWICFDGDDPITWNALLKLTKHLQDEGVVPYLEISRRGGHLWLFTPRISGKIARQFAKAILRQSDLPMMEIYPKQEKLTTGVGSLVRLPLGIHRKTGKRYHFIQLNHEPLAPTIREQIAILSNPQHVSMDFIQQIIAQHPESVQSKPLQFTKVAPVDGKTLSERIKASISVRDFVSRYVELNAHGVGFCPFHEDEHESFGVSEQGNYWNCWAGCGGGSVVDFWMKWREKQRQDASFTATITELAQMLF